jgi:hypothetical protein
MAGVSSTPVVCCASSHGAPDSSGASATPTLLLFIQVRTNSPERFRQDTESRRSPGTAGVGLVLGLLAKGWTTCADLRVGQRSLQLVMEVHGFLQGLAVYKVTSYEATNAKAVCQATLWEANIWP